MLVQSKKRILHGILSLIHRESKTNQVAKQRFAQFAIQNGNLTAVTRKARERQGYWYGIAAHKVSLLVPLSIEQVGDVIFRVVDEKRSGTTERV